jgi:hypothetical protein
MGPSGHPLNLGQKVTAYLTILFHYTHTRSQDDPSCHLMGSLVMKISPIETHYKVQE